MSDTISNESSMTVAVAIAVAIHAVPLLLADPVDEPTIPTEITICGGDWVEEDEGHIYLGAESFDPQLAREQAIELARAGGLGAGPLSSPTPPAFPQLSFDQGELYLAEHDCGWYCYRTSWTVRQDPQLAVAMREPTVAPLSIYPVQLAGGLDRSTVRRYLKRNLSALARCEQPLEPLGDVMAQILIDRVGRVVQANIVSDRADVVACIQQALFAIEFPRPPNRELTQVNVPLHYGTTVASAGNLVR